MTIITKNISLQTNEGDIIDITRDVDQLVRDTDLRAGIAVIFVSGSTGAITTIEYEPGLLKDISDALERLMPRNIKYMHELRWHDGNGHSHIRASFLGPSLTVPFKDKRLILGTWQQIIFLELDNKPRSRNLIVQIIGE